MPETLRRTAAAAVPFALALFALVSFALGLAACGDRAPSGAETSGSERARPGAERTTLTSTSTSTAGRDRSDGARSAEAQGADRSEEPLARPVSFTSRYRRATAFPARSLAESDRQPWRERVPEVEPVAIEASSDGARQPALFYASDSEEDKPLLVVLHSWSATYLQNIHIPYARFAIDNDWVFIHPHFRGPNRRPQATNSALAAADVLDAVEYAQAHARVDDQRIYLLGYSGGAMMGLVLAGQHPERWAGVVAWVPVVDLADWYEARRRVGSRYAEEIEDSCGGEPAPGTPAATECQRRSPLAWLPKAAGRTPIFIAHGIDDHLASPEHAVRAFNALAAPEDRISDEHRAQIARDRTVPPELRASGGDASFRRANAQVMLDRRSNGARLVLFEGEHDMLYEPGLRWLSTKRGR